MTYCKKCNGMIGDIGEIHACLFQPDHLYNPPMTGLPPMRIPVKCAQCGSTTIDHTENQCQINRQLPKVDELK